MNDQERYNPPVYVKGHKDYISCPACGYWFRPPEPMHCACYWDAVRREKEMPA